MRTNIVIDDTLMTKALKISGLKTKKKTIEKALELMIQINKQTNIRKYRGKLNWESNLDDMRIDL